MFQHILRRESSARYPKNIGSVRSRNWFPMSGGQSHREKRHEFGWETTERFVSRWSDCLGHRKNKSSKTQLYHSSACRSHSLQPPLFHKQRSADLNRQLVFASTLPTPPPEQGLASSRRCS